MPTPENQKPDAKKIKQQEGPTLAETESIRFVFTFMYKILENDKRVEGH